MLETANTALCNPAGSPIFRMRRRMPASTRSSFGSRRMDSELPVKQRRADCVGDHRGDGNAVHRHVQDGHEEQVQRDVQHAGYRQREQRNPRLAYAAEDGRFKVVQQDDRHSGKIDAQIQKRQREYVVRYVEQPQQRRGDKLSQQRDQHAARERENHGRVYRLLHVLLPPLSDGVRNNHVGPQRDADEQIDDQTDDWAVRPYGRYGGGALRAGEIADYGDVGGVEKLFQNRCRRDRQRKLRQLVPDRPVQHIQLLFACSVHHCVPYPVFIPHYYKR